MPKLETQKEFDDTEVEIAPENNAVYIKEGYGDVTLSLTQAREIATWLLANLPEKQ